MLETLIGLSRVEVYVSFCHVKPAVVLQMMDYFHIIQGIRKREYYEILVMVSVWDEHQWQFWKIEYEWSKHLMPNKF